MELIVDLLSWVFLTAGAVFCVIGGIGLLRMPGFYSRTHAAGVTDTLGAGLVILGLALQSGWSEITIKLLLILVFLFVTSPTAAHALVNGAYTQGLEPRLDGDEDAS